MGKYEAIIEILCDRDYYRAKNLINLLGDKETFADVLIKIANPYVYDRFTKMYEYKMYTSFYNEARKKIIKNNLNLVSLILILKCNVLFLLFFSLYLSCSSFFCCIQTL